MSSIRESAPEPVEEYETWVKFNSHRIETAKRDGKDGFDNQRYMVAKKPKEER